MRVLLIAFSACCVVSGIGLVNAQGEPSSSTAPAADSRPQVMTGDGVELPQADAERKFRTTSPVVGAVLGARPDEAFAAARVFSTDKSFDRLAAPRIGARTIAQPFFVMGIFGADVVGLDLDKGRIKGVTLYYGKGSKKEIRQRLSGLYERLDPAYVCDDPEEETGRTFVSLKINPKHYALAYLDWSSDIKEAVKRGDLRQGMTLEQAVMALDKAPSKTDSAKGQEWRWRLNEKVSVTYKVRGEQRERLVSRTRIVTAITEGEKIKSWSEEISD
jgi:hypothetical protein